jgi:hypothetical protein
MVTVTFCLERFYTMKVYVGGILGEISCLVLGQIVNWLGIIDSKEYFENNEVFGVDGRNQN